MRKQKIIKALFSDTRGLILAKLLLHPEKWWFLSDLASHLGKTPSSLQRELISLSLSGILEKRTDGKRVYYRASSDCPILNELQNIFIKTTGVADVVKNSLKSFFTDIDFMFIFGSIARGEELSSSDVDLLIVGAISLSQIAPKLRRIESSLMREVNPVVLTLAEFEKRVKEKNHFVMNVINSEKIFLKGEREYLEATALT